MADNNRASTAPKSRPRNPEATTRDILIAARDEFVEYGLNGATMGQDSCRSIGHPGAGSGHVSDEDPVGA
ncbi:MAG: hypothetical protein ACO4AU_12700, partial [bacterium]|jgi:hypothetical protein